MSESDVGTAGDGGVCRTPMGKQSRRRVIRWLLWPEDPWPSFSAVCQVWGQRGAADLASMLVGVGSGRRYPVSSS